MNMNMNFEGVEVIINETKKFVKCVSAYATLSTAYDSVDEVKRFVYKFIKATLKVREQKFFDTDDNCDDNCDEKKLSHGVTDGQAYCAIATIGNNQYCILAGRTCINIEYLDVVLDFDLGYDDDDDKTETTYFFRKNSKSPMLKQVVDAYVDYYFNEYGL